MTVEDRRISAAEGYQALGMQEDALSELTGLSEAALERADALEVLTLYYVNREDWATALRHAMHLCAVAPGQPGGFIHTAYCLHELGRTRDAARLLEQGPAVLKKQPVYFYNLSCYYTRLGELPKAARLLHKSFEMDPTLRRSAMGDPDLVSLFHSSP